MAPYIARYIETPMFVMNSAYDAWQMGNILHAACIPTPGKPCTVAQNASITAYRDKFVKDVAAVTAGKPHNGVYVDSCYVHEQNVNYCGGQCMPNCVGWSPLSTASKKWGYTTSVRAADGRALTPQQAFSAYYFDGKDAVTVDQTHTLDNPSCRYPGRKCDPLPPTR